MNQSGERQFVYPFQVEWDHLDANMHVANTAYNIYCTNARVQFFMDCGFRFLTPLEAPKDENAVQHGPVVLTDTVHYRRELKFGDRGEVELELLGLSQDHGRWKVRHTLRKSTGEIAAILESLGGWIHHTLRKLQCPQGSYAEQFALLRRAPDFEELKPLTPGK